ncbi:MAG: hypothetical protein U9O87_05960 [Verrucomicrobiota bacterium]|nr:hypothetical protein [Verrucomicrobiota bacterium]
MTKKTDKHENPAEIQSSKENIPIEDLVSLIKEICMLFSEVTLYSWDHAATQRRFPLTWNKIKEILDKYGDINLNQNQGKIFFAGRALEENNPSVKKFTEHLNHHGINSLTFKKELSIPEFEAFFRIFCQHPADLKEQGGMNAAFDILGIKSVSLNSTMFRMIKSNEKIVKTSAVYLTEAKTFDKAQEAVFRDFYDSITGQNGNKLTILNEIKNNPSGMADQVIQIIKNAAEKEEDFNKNTLLQKMEEAIMSASQSIAGLEITATSPENAKKMDEAMQVMKNELERNSKILSSKGAITFLKHITDIIASYSTTYKAQSVLSEFVEHQHSTSSAEKVLNEISPDNKTTKKILSSIKKIMDAQNIDAGELVELLQENITKSKLRTRKKTTRQFKPLAERIKNKLKSEFKGVKKKDQLVAYLNNVYSRDIKREVKEQTEKIKRDFKEIKGQAKELKKDLKLEQVKTKDISRALIDLQIGMLILDEDEKVISIINASNIPRIKEGEKLPEKLYNALKNYTTETTVEYDNYRFLQIERNNKNSLESIVFVPSDAY